MHPIYEVYFKSVFINKKINQSFPLKQQFEATPGA